MEPQKRTVHEFLLKTDGYFQIPDFQRPYTWGEYQMDTFLSDVKKVAETQKIHYFGTVVRIQETDRSVIIDGQQRITTSLLFINAAYHVLKESPEKGVNYDSELILNQFLVNTYNSNKEHREKITLRTVSTDNTILEKLFAGEELSENEKANNLSKAHSKFRKFVESLDCLDSYLDALKRFEIVVVTLTDEKDDAQLVFENINSTGEPLSAGDKIRNWALMLNNADARRIVYDDYWKKIENKLTCVIKGKQIDYISDFFRTYLTCRNNEFISDAATYPMFKNLLKASVNDNDIESIRTFYDDVMRYLAPYLTVKLMVVDPALKVFDEQIFSLKLLQMETINSFAISLFVDFMAGKLTEEEVSNSLSLVESFLVRRVIYGFTTEAYNRRFPALHKAVRAIQEKHPNKRYDDCFCAHMLARTGRTVSMPTDADIINSITSQDFYRNKTYLRYFILGKICDQSKESNVLRNIHEKRTSLTIEHVMPQTLSTDWKADLGEDWEKVHGKWLHTLANLTLTAYNAKYSNSRFNTKKTIDDGFIQSPLLLNQYIAKFDIWNEDTLVSRASWLSEQIAKTWKYPTTTLSLSTEMDDYDHSYSPYDLVEILPNLSKKPLPVTLTIDGKVVTVKTWKATSTKIWQFILDKFPEKFNQLIDNVDEVGSGKRNDQPLLSKNKNVFRTPDEVTAGVFASNHFNTVDRMEYIIKICEYVGYTKDTCPVSFTLRERTEEN